jgi:hypothetical protein
LLANWLYVINYVPLTLFLFFYTEKWGAKLLCGPHCFEWGPVAPLPPCDGAPVDIILYVVLFEGERFGKREIKRHRHRSINMHP